MTPQPVQPAKSLRERPHAARLRDEVLRIDIGAHLQRLRGDHDQMTLAAGRGFARGCHAVHRIENPRPGPLRLPFPGTAGQQQDLSRSVRGQRPQTAECLPRTLGRVGEHHACRRSGRLSDQVERGLGQPVPDVAGVEDAHRVSASPRPAAAARPRAPRRQRRDRIAMLRRHRRLPSAPRRSAVERASPSMACAPGVHSASAGSNARRWGAKCASSRMTRLSVPATAASIGRIDLVVP